MGLDLYDTNSPEMKALLESWSYPYNYLLGIIQKCFKDKYNTVEEYLFDTSLDSIYTLPELYKLYMKNNTNTIIHNRVYNQLEEGKKEIDEKLFSGELTQEDADTEKARLEKEANERIQKEEEDTKKREKEEREKEKAELKKLFRSLFNKKKSDVALAISNIYDKLKKEKDEFSFNEKKSIYTSEDYIESNFKETFLPALEPVKDDAEVLKECEEEIDDFINGRYASIRALTFSDTNAAKSAKEKEEKELAKTAEKAKKEAEKDKDSPNKFNGTVYQRSIDTQDIEYSEDEDGFGNTKSLFEISDLIVKDIIEVYGLRNRNSVTVDAAGGLIINNSMYKPNFGPKFMASLAGREGILDACEEGNIASVCSIGTVVRGIMQNVQVLSIEDTSLPNDSYFLNELGVGSRAKIGKLFKKYKSLQYIYLPDEELSRERPDSTKSEG